MRLEAVAEEDEELFLAILVLAILELEVTNFQAYLIGNLFNHFVAMEVQAASKTSVAYDCSGEQLNVRYIAVSTDT